MDTLDWTPTPHLRYRLDWRSDERATRVLQQRWMHVVHDPDAHRDEIEYEWRDVPLEATYERAE